MKVLRGPSIKVFKKLTEEYFQAESKEDPVENMLKIYSRKHIPRGVPLLSKQLSY